VRGKEEERGRGLGKSVSRGKQTDPLTVSDGKSTRSKKRDANHVRVSSYKFLGGRSSGDWSL